MGASDSTLFYYYKKYIDAYLIENISSTDTCKKIAWFGAQRPYQISNHVTSINSKIENHYFDFTITSDEQHLHNFDLNQTGWGGRLKEQGFNIITILRCSCYIYDHANAIKDFKDFLDGPNQLIWFEDMDPKLYKEPDISTYGKFTAIKSQRHFTMKKLEEHFNVTNKIRLFDPFYIWYDQCILSKK